MTELLPPSRRELVSWPPISRDVKRGILHQRSAARGGSRGVAACAYTTTVSRWRILEIRRQVVPRRPAL